MSGFHNNPLSAFLRNDTVGLNEVLEIGYGFTCILLDICDIVNRKLKSRV